MIATERLMVKLNEDPEARNEMVASFLADTKRGGCDFCSWTRDPTHNNTQATEAHAEHELNPANW